MAQKNQLSQWANIAKMAAAIIALATLFLGGGFFYTEIWNVPDLRYIILPTYDVEELALSGLIVENRGRVPARDVEIILVDLEKVIERLYMPGPHEKVDTTWSPQNLTNEATIEMERLSPGSSLLIYLLTRGPVTLDEGKTFIISSDRGRATSAFEDTEQELIQMTILGCGGFIGVVIAMVVGILLGWRARIAREKLYLQNPEEEPKLLELLEEMHVLERAENTHS